MATNYLTGQEYKGQNAIALNILSSGYPTNEWVTYKQAQELAGTVIKGQKGVKLLKVIDEEDTGKVSVRGFVVFNIAQCENIDSDLRLTPEQYEIYKVLKREESLLTRKQKAKTAQLV
jgi:antirestriction protein ArdC